MKLNINALKKIEKYYDTAKHESGKRYFKHGLYAGDGANGVCIYSNLTNSFVCNLEDIQNLIEELSMMKNAVESATGIIIESTNH